MKLEYGTSKAPAQPSFRAFTGAVSLKLGVDDRVPDRAAAFRAFTGAVSLKLPEYARLWDLDAEAFRAFTGAVSLKPAFDGLQANDENSLPRLHRRGLIEAGYGNGVEFVPFLLPRLHRRGLIEAFCPAPPRPCGGGLPRLHRRGLIEATQGCGWL